MHLRKIDKGLIRELLFIGLIVFFVLLFMFIMNYSPLP